MTLRHTAQDLSRRLLIGLSLACLLGQAWVGWGWSGWWLVGLAACLVGVTWVWAGLRSAGLVGCLVLSLAAGHLSLLRVLEPPLPAEHVGRLSLPQKTVLAGWLYREPERLPHRTRLYLAVTQRDVQGAARPAVGRVLVSVRHPSGAWQYGDVVRLPVRLRAPRNFRTPGSFDHEGYLARRSIYVTAFVWNDDEIEKIGTRGSSIRHWLEQVRRRIGAFFDAHLARHNAAVLRALIIGDRSGIDRSLQDAFARAGVAHVLAISGLHIGIVAAVAYNAWWWLLGRSRRLLLSWTMPRLAALLAIPSVLLYAGLAGGRVATWRAVVMVLVYLGSILIGRQHEVYRSLALAALLISAIWPGAVFEVSFQLSFVAVLAIFAGLSRLSAWWEQFRTRQLQPWRGRVLRWGLLSGAVSGCAILGTAPVTAAHFNQISIAGFMTNLVIIPLLGSVAVISGLAAAGLLFVHEGLARLLVLAAGGVVQISTWIVEVVGAWPYAAFDVVTPNLFELAVLYGMGACLFLGFRSSQPVRYVLLVYAPCCWLTAPTGPGSASFDRICGLPSGRGAGGRRSDRVSGLAGHGR